MKRNENIAPLSRDHHSGLLCCWKLRQGITHGVAPQRMKEYVKWYWAHHLEQHFLQEETLLFNTIAHPQCEEALQQHRLIKKMISDLHSEDPEPATFTLFADTLDNHIRFEERILFPILEKELPEPLLQNIGEKLHSLHAHPFTDDYPDEFWKK
jgi:hemerythrin-like domain-containing protein